MRHLETFQFSRGNSGSFCACQGPIDNRGYIKVARELVKVVYAVWSKGVDYQPVPPARPGSNKNKKKSRSETGQLLHPMVHALTA